MANKSKLEEMGGKPEGIGRASSKRMKDQEGIVKASDASFAGRLAKKMFGSPISDLSNKELNKLRGLPAMMERAERRELTKKAYLDAILRDYSELGGKFGSSVGREARENRARVNNMLRNSGLQPLKTFRYGGKVEKMMYGGSVKEMEAGGIAGGNCRGGGAALRGTKFSGVK